MVAFERPVLAYEEIRPMSAVASPAPAALIRVAAGTTAGAAVREAGSAQPGRARRDRRRPRRRGPAA